MKYKDKLETTQVKKKYWYRDEVDVCVLCGKETHNRERVYDEKEKGTVWKDDACQKHFM